MTSQTGDFLWMLPKNRLCHRLDICRDFMGLGMMALTGARGTQTPGKAPLAAIPTFCPLFPPRAAGFVPPPFSGVLPKQIRASKLPSLPCFPPTTDPGAPRWDNSGKLWKGFNQPQFYGIFPAGIFPPLQSLPGARPWETPPRASLKFLGNSAFPRCCYFSRCFHEDRQDPYSIRDPYPGRVPIPAGNYWSVTQVSLPRTDTKRQSEMGILAFNRDEDMDESRFIPTPAATDSVSIS